ncbi:hypothetical protein ABGB08_14705 [Acrocarpospora sp. B8E8]
MEPDLGPCGIRDCTADAVAVVFSTVGESARLTVVIGTRAAELADGPVAAEAVCHEHAGEALDALLLSAGKTRKAHR